MKKLIALLLTLSLALAMTAYSQGEAATFSEKDIPVLMEDGDTQTFRVRFYPDQPNIPYCGLRAYSEFLGVNPLTCEAAADGTWVFASAQGAKAIVDPGAGTITVDDWSRFLYPALPFEGNCGGLKDTKCGFVRIVDMGYEETARPLTLNLGRYGLRMYPGDQDVFMSMTLISGILSDVSTLIMSWNGERARLGRFGTPLLEGPDMDSAMMRALMTEGVRPEDTAKETWAEFCFYIDHFYGHPDVVSLDDAIAEKGLQQALLDLGEEGKALVEAMQSTRGHDYLKGMITLLLFYLYDGHTADMYITLYDSWTLDDTSNDFDLATLASIYQSPLYLQAMAGESIVETRTAIWGDEPYREYGSTAIIRIDSFMPDEAGWEAFYRDGGEIPQDTVGNVITGLQRAAANPAIKNVLFDLSYNEGGASDALAFITTLSVGANRIYGIDKLTGRRMTVTFEVDTNLDGVFDERDADVIYDQFNYGVLTSMQAFSCGNLFPFMMQGAGAVLLGEPTSGGSCCVQLAPLSDGDLLCFSSGLWQVTDGNYISVEDGCKTDLPIDHEESIITEDGFSLPTFDYSAYYDDAMLDNMMNEWFAEAAMAPAA